MYVYHSSSHRDEHVSRRGSRLLRVGTMCLPTRVAVAAVRVVRVVSRGSGGVRLRESGPMSADEGGKVFRYGLWAMAMV